ncbi:MAG TPA: phosphatase PAP2 family protein [Spirochaetota bacterium]|nr:phosphatase PAP2 family protein [Spirochaetota bacterium]HPF07931.1 phosphatase PAP2 family protein [Spirochaetota bacterium]HPJ42082.1 phosphatase PAP2 family protein [Spirochaetota bacterium]HPR36971.1 phosphatase PAP2 family protein [Spirochaetota bacterium]HRX47597.1 phosphatase PAP2 family protein [Spirochaetota bacterium]
METILFIQTFKTPFLDYFFQFITMSGEQPFFILLACWFTWCYDKEAGWRLGFIFLTGTALNSALKDIFCIPRPIGRDEISSMRTHTAKGYSFPSGHTQSAALCWFSLIKIYKGRYLLITGTVIVILVGISRLYLGVHWPSDVIGGALIGAAWVFTADYLWKRFNGAGNIRFTLIILAVLATVCILFPSNYMIRTTGAAAGFLSGIIFEKRYLNFHLSGNIINSVIRFLSGIIVVVLLLQGSKILLPKGGITTGVTFAILGLWITYGAPVFFTKSRKLIKIF